MKALIKENWVFLSGYFTFLTAALVVIGNIDKGDVIFFFAAHRTPFWNSFFSFATQLGEIVGYLLFGIIFLFVRYRYTILLGVIVGLVGVFAFIFKNLFRHPRPKPYFSKLGQDISEIAVAGQPLLESQISSFPSGHTMSGFAFFTILALLSHQNWVKVLCLILAIFVGISRVYLVHHFLEDVVLGSFLGVLLAFIIQYFHLKVDFQKPIWYNRKIEWFRKIA